MIEFAIEMNSVLIDHSSHPASERKAASVLTAEKLLAPDCFHKSLVPKADGL